MAMKHQVSNRWAQAKISNCHFIEECREPWPAQKYFIAVDIKLQT